MEITKSNVLVAIVLLGSIAHVMILMNGYWADIFWFSTIMVIGIPILIHKSSRKKKIQRYREIISQEI
ncbi:MAG: hypothetical protein R3237_01925 [Nitrosopumilaceae archaeon]|nr:hypothetical protein [Nitrosopumilaceae archaeon]